MSPRPDDASNAPAGRPASRPTESDATETGSRGRTALRRVGLAAVVLGIGVALVGDPSLPVVGTDNRIGVVLVAAAAALVGLGLAVQRDVSHGTWWRPDDPEPGTAVAVPGAAYADLRDHELKRRIRRRASASLMDATGCSRETADRLITEGRWTDDRFAAAYLGDGLRVGLLTRLAQQLRGASVDERAKRRTIAAIRAIRAGEAVPQLEAAETADDEGEPVDSGTETAAEGSNR